MSEIYPIRVLEGSNRSGNGTYKKEMFDNFLELLNSINFHTQKIQ
jgi:hypothetical protein